MHRCVYSCMDALSRHHGITIYGDDRDSVCRWVKGPEAARSYKIAKSEPQQVRNHTWGHFAILLIAVKLKRQNTALKMNPSHSTPNQRTREACLSVPDGDDVTSKLLIGDKFAHIVSTDPTIMHPNVEFYEKKSLSSAFILDPHTLERSASARLFNATFSGFGGSVEVHKLA